jgi:hypothetical protein
MEFCIEAHSSTPIVKQIQEQIMNPHILVLDVQINPESLEAARICAGVVI